MGTTHSELQPTTKVSRRRSASGPLRRGTSKKTRRRGESAETTSKSIASLWSAGETERARWKHTHQRGRTRAVALGGLGVDGAVAGRNRYTKWKLENVKEAWKRIQTISVRVVGTKTACCILRMLRVVVGAGTASCKCCNEANETTSDTAGSSVPRDRPPLAAVKEAVLGSIHGPWGPKRA